MKIMFIKARSLTQAALLVFAEDQAGCTGLALCIWVGALLTIRHISVIALT